MCAVLPLQMLETSIYLNKIKRKTNKLNEFLDSDSLDLTGMIELKFHSCYSLQSIDYNICIIIICYLRSILAGKNANVFKVLKVISYDGICVKNIA